MKRPLIPLNPSDRTDGRNAAAFQQGKRESPNRPCAKLRLVHRGVPVSPMSFGFKWGAKPLFDLSSIGPPIQFTVGAG